MLLEFYREKNSDKTKTCKRFSYQFWIDANHIGTVTIDPQAGHECIRLGLNSSSVVWLCPEKHPLESIEETVKVINRAKKASRRNG